MAHIGEELGFGAAGQLRFYLGGAQRRLALGAQAHVAERFGIIREQAGGAGIIRAPGEHGASVPAPNLRTIHSAIVKDCTDVSFRYSLSAEFSWRGGNDEGAID